MAAVYKLLIDWRDNGFGDPADDVTLRVLDQRTTVTARYGRDQARQLSPTSPGEAAFELNNISRDYSPENTASPLAGFIAPGRHVQLQAIVAGVTTVLYDGYLDDFDIKPEISDRSVPATCLDALGRLRGVTVTTPLYQGVRTGTAIGYVLDAVGWPAGARDLDSGASYLPYWWLDGEDAFDALMALADSEGPAALVSVDEAGRIIFRDRHHRLTRAASLTAQATWRSSAVEPVISSPVTYNHGWKEIVNSVSVQVPVRSPDPAPTVVWSSPGQLSITAGTTLNITAHCSNPFFAATVPAQDVDYTLISGSVTPALSATSGQSVTISLTSAGGAVIQDLQLQAVQVQAASIVVSEQDLPSIARYGEKSMSSGRLPVWANPYDADAILQLILAKRAERLPTLQVTMRGAANSTRLAECLGRNLSDRVHVTEALTGLDADCFIEQISHAITDGGASHVTTFGLEKIPPVVATPFMFDTSGQGFDQGLFEGGGLDDPTTMFRFDTSGVGFDQGVFAN